MAILTSEQPLANDSRRRFIKLVGASLGVLYLDLWPQSLFSQVASSSLITVTDVQLATAGFTIGTLTDPVERQRAINTLLYCSQEISQVKTLGSEKVTADLNRQFALNRDLGDIFEKAQDFLDNQNFTGFEDTPLVQKLFSSIPLFAGIVDPAVGLSLSLVSDFDFANNPDYVIPSGRLEALSTVFMGHVQALLDLNPDLVDALNQSDIHLNLGLNFDTSDNALNLVPASVTQVATIARTTNGSVDVPKTLSNATAATQVANQQYATDTRQASSAPDPAVALKLAHDKFRNTLDEITGGVAIASFVAGSILGDSKAATDITKGGTAAINVASAIESFSDNLIGPLGLASSLLGGVQAFSALFGGGSTPDQLILQAIGQLGAQMRDFWNDMDIRLIAIEEQQTVVLSKLQDLSDALFTTGQILQVDIQNVQDHISQLSESVSEDDRERYINSLSLSNNDLASNIAISGDDYLGVFNSYRSDLNAAYTYATSTCFLSSFTGSVPNPSGQAFVTKIGDESDSNNLIAIAAYIALTKGLLPSAIALPNPNEWARGASSFLQMSAASLRMRNPKTTSGWFSRLIHLLFGNSKNKKIRKLYDGLDQQTSDRYKAVSSVGAHLRSTIIETLTSRPMAIHVCSAYMESFCADTTFRNLPDPTRLPPALDQSLTVSGMLKPIFDAFIDAAVPTPKVLNDTDPTFATSPDSLINIGQLGAHYAKVQNNPVEYAVQQGAIVLVPVADIDNGTLSNGVKSETKVSRPVSALTGSPILAGQLVTLVVETGPPNFVPNGSVRLWSLYPDNGDYQGSTGSLPRSLAQLVQMAPAFSFLPMIDAATNILRTEYISAQLRSGFAGYVNAQLSEGQISTFIQAAASYRLIATLIARRYVYSDSSDDSSLLNCFGWFSKADLCSAIGKVANRHTQTIAETDWWTTIQTDLASSLRQAVTNTFSASCLCDPKQSFPAIDDTLRQLDTAAKLQGFKIPS